MMVFEDALGILLKRAQEENWPWKQLEAAVADLHQQYNREVPPPITGTVTVVEPEDKFGG